MMMEEPIRQRLLKAGRIMATKVKRYRAKTDPVCTTYDAEFSNAMNKALDNIDRLNELSNAELAAEYEMTQDKKIIDILEGRKQKNVKQIEQRQRIDWLLKWAKRSNEVSEVDEG